MSKHDSYRWRGWRVTQTTTCTRCKKPFHGEFFGQRICMACRKDVRGIGKTQVIK